MPAPVQEDGGTPEVNDRETPDQSPDGLDATDENDVSNEIDYTQTRPTSDEADSETQAA